jgi:hypothetical protein
MGGRVWGRRQVVIANIDADKYRDIGSRYIAAATTAVRPAARDD